MFKFLVPRDCLNILPPLVVDTAETANTLVRKHVSENFSVDIYVAENVMWGQTVHLAIRNAR